MGCGRGRAWGPEGAAAGEENNSRGTGNVQGRTAVIELWGNGNYPGRWDGGGNRTGVIWKPDFILLMSQFALPHHSAVI